MGSILAECGENREIYRKIQTLVKSPAVAISVPAITVSVSIPKFIMYFFWLMWQLVLANIDVLLATTAQELDIDPKVVRFYFRADNPMASVVLANSITLTPGTVTINVTDDGLYEIHALTKGAAAGVLDGSMQKKVADLYGEKFDFAVAEGEE